MRWVFTQHQGLSQRGNAAAKSAVVGFRQVADLGARGVRNLQLPESSKPESARAAPDFEHVHRELSRPSVTLLLLWNENAANAM